VVDVEQHALRALEEDSAPGEPRLVQRLPDGPRELQHELGDLAEVALQPPAIDAGLAEAGAECVVMRADSVELRAERAEMGEVADPDRAAPDLVLISGADAAPRGPDLARARGVLAERVEIAVEGENERTGVGDLEPLGVDLDALRAQRLDLGLQRPGIEDDAVADHGKAALHDAGGKERELVGLFADDECMAGIVAALESDDEVGAARQPVDDLALALVAPLAADHGNVRQGWNVL